MLEIWTPVDEDSPSSLVLLHEKPSNWPGRTIFQFVFSEIFEMQLAGDDINCAFDSTDDDDLSAIWR